MLFRWLLKRRLTVFQWMALFFLACGTACSQLPTTSPERSSSSSLVALLSESSSSVTRLVAADNKTPIPASIGVIVSLVTALFSSLAGVYNEKLLKDRVVAPIHWQNTQVSSHLRTCLSPSQGPDFLRCMCDRCTCTVCGSMRLLCGYTTAK